MDCVICKKKLKGFQKKYCGDSCADYQKQIVQSQKGGRHSVPKKPCVVCGGVFQPVRKANIVCSRSCGNVRNKMIKKASRDRANCPPPLLNITKHSRPHFNKNCSDNKSAILDFLKRGGKITTLPKAPIGKTPGINMAYGWIPEELFGSALMYEFDEKE